MLFWAVNVIYLALNTSTELNKLENKGVYCIFFGIGFLQVNAQSDYIALHW